MLQASMTADAVQDPGPSPYPGLIDIGGWACPACGSVVFREWDGYGVVDGKPMCVPCANASTGPGKPTPFSVFIFR